jgi:hypothetical protein
VVPQDVYDSFKTPKLQREGCNPRVQKTHVRVIEIADIAAPAAAAMSPPVSATPSPSAAAPSRLPLGVTPAAAPSRLPLGVTPAAAPSRLPLGVMPAAAPAAALLCKRKHKVGWVHVRRGLETELWR